MFAIVRLMLSLALPVPLDACNASGAVDVPTCAEQVCRVTAIDYDASECDGLADSLRAIGPEDCATY